MNAILNVVLPVFAIMACGWLCGRTKLLEESSTQGLNSFVYYVALPAVLFGSMARAPLDQAFNGPFLLSFVASVLFSFAVVITVTALRTRDLSIIVMAGLTATFSNTGYMGIPLLQSAFGEAGTLPGASSTVVNTGLILGVGIAILEIDRHRELGFLHALKAASKGLAKSPLIIAPATGLLWSFTGLDLPSPVDRFLNLLGASAGPVALFAMGLFLVGKPLRAGLGEVFWLSVIKLVVMPLIAVWMVFDLFTGMDPLLAGAAVIQSALPTGGLMFIIAQRYNIFLQRAVSTILISTILSVFTLSAVFVLLDVQ